MKTILKRAQAKGFDKDLTDKLYHFLNKYSHLDRIEGHDHTIENIEGEGIGVAQDTLKVISTLDSEHHESMIELFSGKK